MLSTAVLVLFLLLASWTDFTRQKVYNWTTYPGMLAGVLLRALEDGSDGLGDAFTGWLVCGLVMLVCLVFFQVGGGDVKLIAMMGAFLGLHRGIEAMLWTFIIGAAMAIAVLVWQLGAWHILKKTLEHARFVLKARRWLPLTTSERAPLRQGLFLAPAGLVAVCIVQRHLVEW